MSALDRIRALLGSRTADLSALVSAVHRVNPTDRHLPPGEEAERYRLKAALQSRLLRDYPAHVEVVADGEDIVLLRCPTDGRDAAHVPVTALDDDVRVLVRERLDGVASDEAHPAEAREPTADPLAEGRAALEAWDYDGAAAAFDRAARAGSAAAARQAMELRVEMLGDLDGARSLARTLAPGTRRDPAVRAFLALGEARSGDAAEAERLLRGLTGDRAGEAWETLARRADRPADVSRCVDRGKAADPGRRQAWLALADALHDARESARRPWQERLDAALAAEDPETARTVLAEAEAALAPDPWPRTQHERVERVEAALEATRRVDAADRAEASGHPAVALRELRRARDAGAVGLDARMARLRAEVGAARHARAVAAVDRALADPSVDALVAWLALPAPDREALTATHAWLGWLAGDLPRAAVRRADRLLDAALALQATASATPDQAAPLLAPHRAVIDLLPGAAARLVEIDTAVAAARARERATALADARACLEAGELERAEALVADAGGDRELERALAQERAHRALEDALDDADPWTRVRMLRAEARRTGSPRWDFRAWQATQAARHATDCWSFRRGHGRRMVMNALVDGAPRPHVRSGHAYLMSAVGGAVELIEVRLADSVVTRGATFGLRRWGDPAMALHGDTGWIAVDRGLIQIDLRTLQIVAHHRLSRKPCTSGHLIAAASWIWWKPEIDERKWVPIDARTGTVEWSRAVSFPIFQVPGLDGLLTKRRTRATLCDSRLAPVLDLGLSPLGVAGFAFARGPAGRTLVLGARTSPPDTRVELWRLDPDGGEPDRLGDWPIAAEGAFGLLACDGERIFVGSERPGTSRLGAYRLVDGALQLLWEVPINLRQVSVVQDHGGGPVWVLVVGVDGPAATRLGPEEPAPFDYGLVERPLSVDTEEHARVVHDAFDLADQIERFGADAASVGVSDDDLIEAICYADASLTDAQRRRAKTVPRLRAALADDHCGRGEWVEAARLLDGLPLRHLENGESAIRQHVVALALAGRLEDAVARTRASDYPADLDSEVLRAAVERALSPEPGSVHARAQAALDAAAHASPADVARDLGAQTAVQADVVFHGTLALAERQVDVPLQHRLWTARQLEHASWRRDRIPWRQAWPRARVDATVATVQADVTALRHARPRPTPVVHVERSGDTLTVRPGVDWGAARVDGGLAFQGEVLVEDPDLEDRARAWFRAELGADEVTVRGSARAPVEQALAELAAAGWAVREA